MTQTYKCLSSDFPQLEKKIKRIAKKLDKHGLSHSFQIIATYPEKVDVLDYTGRENVPVWQFTPKKSSIITDVTEYTFEMESLKIGEYDVVAVIEHNMIEHDNSLNMIHVIKENYNVPAIYQTIESNCEHCNVNRQRNKTVLLEDKDGNIIQVGTTCLHEYTGIDCNDIIQYYADVRTICTNEPYINMEDRANYDTFKYTQTINFLASCIQQIKNDGYKKDVTKSRAWENVKHNDYLNQLDLAQKVIDYFTQKQISEYDNFLHNIKAALTQEYTKCNGFIAYAYIAYQKEIEKDKEKETDQVSEYIGNVKDKIEIEVTLKSQCSFETEYGYQTIYLFSDSMGNILKWKTGNGLGKYVDERWVSYEIGDTLTLKGTIKAHITYRDVKQTELTRCKVL